jgi:hypothetical protein
LSGFAEAHLGITGVNREQTMKPEVSHQFQIARTKSRQHQAAAPRSLFQLKRNARQHTQERTVHAGTMDEIENETGFALLQHFRDEIPEANAVLKARATADSNHDWIGIGVDQIN